MANLFGKYIYETYKSIIGLGTSGTSGLGANLEPLTDGEGKHLPIEVSETEVNLTAPTTVPNLFIEGYGEVIDSNGYWTGEGGGGGGTGTSGTSGTSGVSGSSGTSGHNGTMGTSGTSGRNGYAGLNGTSGTSGTNGSSGTSGTSGIDGAQGPTGTSGIDGTSGTSGVDGAPGTQNIIINNNAASIGSILPINPYGVINFSAPDTSIYQPDNAQNSIGIGYYGAAFNDAIYIGHYGQAVNNSIVVGHGSFGQGYGQSVIGNGSTIGYLGDNSILFGTNSFIDPNSDIDSTGTIVLGSNNTSVGKKNIVIASDVSLSGDYNTIIGNATISGDETIAFGTGDPSINTSNLLGDRNIAFGKYNFIQANDAIVIGNNSAANANGAVALGTALTANTENTVTMHRLQVADYADLNFTNDTAAAQGGIPLGGIYHTGGLLKIRIL